MIKDFRHACVLVSDLDRAIKFYGDVLGLKVCRILAVEEKYAETVLNKKGAEITYVKMRVPAQSKEIFELHCWKKPKILPRAGYNHISFTVENISREYRRLKKLGVKFISKPATAPHGCSKICFGYDPDKNLIEFVEDLRKK